MTLFCIKCFAGLYIERSHTEREQKPVINRIRLKLTAGLQVDKSPEWCFFQKMCMLVNVPVGLALIDNSLKGAIFASPGLLRGNSELSRRSC